MMYSANIGMHFLQYIQVLYMLLSLPKELIRLLACSLPLFCSLRNIYLFLSYKLAYIVIYDLPDVQAGFRKGRGARDQGANIHWIIKKAIELQKKTSALLAMPKPLTVWITTNWKILKEMGIPDHLTCLLRNLYAS